MPSIALPVSLRGQLLSGSRFNPISLFSAGEQGIWLEPSDLTTMFQDRAGTTPVTAPGQTVGLRLDKSGRGNHAVAPTDAARPTYGIEPKTGRRNLLTQTEDLNSAAWTKITQGSGILPIVTPNAGIDPDGGMTAIRIQLNAGSNGSSDYSLLRQSNSNWPSGRRSIWIKSNTGSNQVLSLVATIPSTKITATTTWQRLTDASDFGPTQFDISVGGAALTDATADILVWHPQRDTTATITNYQRVGTAFDVTEAGVATVHYVQYDGTDDSFSTSSIDFTATDKMSVFAGVRKLSDAAAGTIAEMSAAFFANNGSFALFAAGSTAPTGFEFDSRGTANVLAGAASAAPVTNVLAGIGDISGDRATLRINGTLSFQNPTDQGTGNYGNYPLFIGRRNNTNLPFNGRDYGIIIVGKTASATEIAATEAWLAARTSGVTL